MGFKGVNSAIRTLKGTRQHARRERNSVVLPEKANSDTRIALSLVISFVLSYLNHEKDATLRTVQLESHSELFKTFSLKLKLATMGTETFESNRQFPLAMVGLAGSLLGLMAYCLVSAVMVRRYHLMRSVIQGDDDEGDNGGAQQTIHQQEIPIAHAEPVTFRDGSGSARPGALSFDGREGWRSDAELRGSTRGSRTSSRVNQVI